MGQGNVIGGSSKRAEATTTANVVSCNVVWLIAGYSGPSERVVCAESENSVCLKREMLTTN